MSEEQRDDAVSSPLHALLRRAVDIRADEVRAVLTSFAFFFFLLSSYFVLRPIRDAVAAASGVRSLPWLFAGTLAGTLVLNPFFSALVVRFPVRRVIPISYNFFVANLLIFYGVLRFLSSAEGSAVDIWTGRAFYWWTTVFALFNTSIFWCLMADVFKSEQAKRLFGFIGVGGTLGSLIGSAVTASLATRIGAVNMLLVSATLIELAIITIVRFPLSGHGDPASAATRRGRRGDSDVIGGTVWSGFGAVVRSPYLLGICAFMVLYTIGSTFLYFEQSDIVGRYYSNASTRTAVLAQLEFAAQMLTVLTQIFLTGRFIRWVGLGIALALLPILSIVVSARSARCRRSRPLRYLRLRGVERISRLRIPRWKCCSPSCRARTSTRRRTSSRRSSIEAAISLAPGRTRGWLGSVSVSPVFPSLEFRSRWCGWGWDCGWAGSRLCLPAIVHWPARWDRTFSDADVPYENLYPMCLAR